MARSQWGEERKKSPLWLDIARTLLLLLLFGIGSWIALTKYYDHVALFYGWAIILLFTGCALLLLIYFFSFLISSFSKRLLDLKKLPKFIIIGALFYFGAIPLLRATNEMVHTSLTMLVKECQLPSLYYDLTQKPPPDDCLYDIWGIRKEKVYPVQNDDEW